MPGSHSDAESDVKKRLLAPRPPTPPLAALTLRPPDPKGRALGGAEPVSIADVVGQSKKRVAQGMRAWVKIDSLGRTSVERVDKGTIMRRCDLPARDLRLLDPLFVYPSTILGRDKAIVVNLEQVRCIITADEVLLLNTAEDGASYHHVQEFTHELQRRLTGGSSHGPRTFPWRGVGAEVAGLQGRAPLSSTGSSVDPDDEHQQRLHRAAMTEHELFGGAGGAGGTDLPFEFRALEVALEAACSYLDGQAREIGRLAYPLLEELAYHISTRNLELVRRLKSDLVTLTRRVRKVRDEVEQLMDDDDDMAEMHLTEKKRMRETSGHPHGAASGHGVLPEVPTAFGSLAGVGGSFSAPVSPVGSPGKERRRSGAGRLTEEHMERAFSQSSQLGSGGGSTESVEDVEELEMLLEAYFVVIDGTLNKLTALSQYIDDTEDFINIQLDNVRNQLIKFELLLTTATFVVAIYGVVAGIFGMNIPIGWEENPYAFKWVLVVTGVCCVVIFGAFLYYFRSRNLTIV